MISGMIEGGNAGGAGMAISESLREQLHCREALCEELESLAAAVPDGLAEDIRRLEAAFAAAPEVPPEFAELLDKRFAEARARAEALLPGIEERKRQRIALEEKLGTLLAAGELLTLQEIEHFEQLCREALKAVPAEFAAALEPFRLRLAAEAEAEAARGKAALELTEELKTLIAAEDIAALRDRKPAIETAYAAIGGVPAQAARQYKEALHQASLRIAQHFETLDLARWESYTLKMDICAELDRLGALPEKDLPEVARSLHEIRKKWKTLGAVPREKHDEINGRFLETTRLLQHRVDEFFSHRRQERRQAEADKGALCEEAEKVADSTQWNATAAVFRDLQAKWKTIPHAGSEEGKLFARFRAAADRFFNARKACFAERDRHYQEIAAKKEALIAEAEGLSDGDIRRAKQLRDDFRAAGGAGRAEPELRNRLNTALDAFFNRRRERFAERETECDALIAELRNLAGDPLAGLARSREIRARLRELACRSRERQERDAATEFERALGAARKRENAEKGELERNVARELAAKYAGLKRGEQTEFAVPAAAALFPKLNAAAQLLAQAASGDDAEALEKLEKQFKNTAVEHERICAELEKIGGGTESGSGSLAEELEAAIRGNFARTEARNAVRSIDPAKLTADFLNAGLLPPEELEASFKRFDAALAQAAKEK